MSALPPQPPLAALETTDQFLVSHGKSGAVGVFTVADGLPLRRGTTVILQTPRGLERGTVLGPATLRQARVLGAVSSGSILRCASAADEQRHDELRQGAERFFGVAQRVAQRRELALELLDVELLFDGRLMVLQFLGNETNLDAFAQELQAATNVAVRLENLALPHADDHGGCSKPDCGRDAGGCDSCGSGGGCSSCGSAKVDMRDYFAHLRTQMEQRRTPLL